MKICANAAIMYCKISRLFISFDTFFLKKENRLGCLGG